MKRHLICILVFGFFFSSFAQTRRDLKSKVDHLEKKTEHLAQKFRDLEKASSEMTDQGKKTVVGFRQHKADTAVLIEDLRTEIAKLSGDLAFVKSEMETLQTENKKFIEDIEFRMQELEKKWASNTKIPPQVSPPASNSSVAQTSPEDAYKAALKQVQENRRFAQAIMDLQAFQKNYPKHSLVPNAQYWIGESYYALGKYARAIKEFDEVVKKHPKSSKYCDSLLKQALGFEALKKPKEAGLFYREVVKRCPKTTPARQAEMKLSTLG